MNRSVCIGCRNIPSTQCSGIRYASHRSFERPLSRPKKRSNLPPPAKLPQLTSDPKHVLADSNQYAVSKYDEEAARRDRNFFTGGSSARSSRFALLRKLPRWLKRLFTPGKLILCALIGYAGYRVYNWQTNPGRMAILNSHDDSLTKQMLCCERRCSVVFI